MKLINIILFLIILTSSNIQLYASNTNPVVSNVNFTIEGTTVTVTYDVADAEQNTFTVYMQVSDDGGETWNYDYGIATGNIGTNVLEGINKSITWSYTGVLDTNSKIKVLADDLIGDQIYYGQKIYNTVTIGSQVWLQENLDIGIMIESSGTSDNQINNSTIEKYCYDNDPLNCDIYGGLYQWNEAMQYVTTEGAQGICPSGWHIPTSSEQQTLNNAVGGSSNVLKAIGQGDVAFSGAGTNTSNFSTLLAGYRYFNSNSFYYSDYYAYFWSSTESTTSASTTYLSYYGNDIYSDIYNKNFGFSIRCLKN